MCGKGTISRLAKGDNKHRIYRSLSLFGWLRKMPKWAKNREHHKCHYYRSKRLSHVCLHVVAKIWSNSPSTKHGANQSRPSWGGKIQDVLYRWHFSSQSNRLHLSRFSGSRCNKPMFQTRIYPRKTNTRVIILPTQTMHYIVSFDRPGLVIWWPLSLTVKPNTEGLEDDFPFQCSWICSGPKWRGLREARRCS